MCSVSDDRKKQMPNNDERQEQILQAAAAVIIRQGYDKTTMNDIADEAGVSRGTVYLYFKGKEELLDVLLYREWIHYIQAWLSAIDSEPLCYTIGGYYRAINDHPLIASIMRRDRRMFGNYLRKPNNLFTEILSSSITVDLVQSLQSVGAVRQDLNPEVTAHLLETLSCGQLTIGDFKSSEQFPPFHMVVEALATMIDRWLSPEDGVNSDAGKEIIRQIVISMQEQFVHTMNSCYQTE
jgi:AcrR family transcriptional regulator